ncbi:MAG: hypothetical protein ACE5D8_02370 [Fidelibacterota bacterium]
MGIKSVSFIFLLLCFNTMAQDHPVSMPGLLQNNYSGVVKQTMDQGGYTYVLIDTGQEEVWAAAPEFPVKVGENVNFSGGMEMRDFTSTSTGQTFDKIYFVGRIFTESEQEPVTKAPHGTLDEDDMGAPTLKKAAVALDPQADVTAIADLAEHKTDWNGKRIKLRGKVVKFTPEIMGTNWIHLQDGSDFDGFYDLTITTNDVVKVNAVITIEGLVTLQKDFGYGYYYDIIVADARVIQ